MAKNIGTEVKRNGEDWAKSSRRLVEARAEGLLMSGQCRTRALAMAQAKYDVEKEHGAESIRAAFAGRDGDRGAAGRGSVQVG
jgi:hypothetical protein